MVNLIHAETLPADPDRNRSSVKRRRLMLDWMREQKTPVSGGELAKYFRVSRQCVVQDIAILRAAGEEIIATPQGYRLSPETVRSQRAVLACRHSREETEEELQILVDNGVRILDVVVEHALYGELRGTLMIESRVDLQNFMEHVKGARAPLLSSLTDGVHLHTVEASRPQMIARAKAQLKAKGFLLK